MSARELVLRALVIADKDESLAGATEAFTLVARRRIAGLWPHGERVNDKAIGAAANAEER